MPTIHPTALVDAGAKLAADVTIGAYSIIGPQVKIAQGTKIANHTEISGHTTIGKECIIGSFCALGGAPQHRSYAGEPTALIIGNHVEIREQVVIHRGSQVPGYGITAIGDHCYLMAQSHVGHDCILGQNVTLTNGAMLAGHVEVGDRALFGGLCGIHQFVRIGTGALVGGQSTVVHDVPPFCAAIGNRARLEGLNLVGLKRNGVEKSTIRELQSLFNQLFRDDSAPITIKLAQWREEHKNPVPELTTLADFIQSSKRNLTPGSSRL